MVISNIIGGLGNQMFQYAAGHALALRLGVDFKIDTRDFLGYQLHQGFELDRLFNCDVKFATKSDLVEVLGWQATKPVQSILRRPLFKVLRKIFFIVEPFSHYWAAIEELVDKKYLYGYWQSEKYFVEIDEVIRKDFVFNLPLLDENKEIAEQISKVNSVSLHVRRGDYVHDTKNSFIGTCSLDYYRLAMDEIKCKVKNPVFFVFSDDIAWVKDNLPLEPKGIYVNNNSGKESYNDMHLMSLCQHNVIANSSFSWWGAWLNANPKKIVIAPKKWFASNRPSNDLVPDSWLKL